MHSHTCGLSSITGAFLDKEYQLPQNAASGYLQLADSQSRGFPYIQVNPQYLINKLDFATKVHEVRRIDCRFCNSE